MHKAELFVTDKCYGNCRDCFGQDSYNAKGEHVPVDKLQGRIEKVRAFNPGDGYFYLSVLGGNQQPTQISKMFYVLFMDLW